MTPINVTFLVSSAILFIAAASAAKNWALSNSSALWLLLTLFLYTAGNLIMLRLIKDIGMGIALSLSALVQLLAVNLVALFVFGERVAPLQGFGLVLAIIAIAMITLPKAS